MCWIACYGRERMCEEYMWFCVGGRKYVNSVCGVVCFVGEREGVEIVCEECIFPSRPFDRIPLLVSNRWIIYFALIYIIVACLVFKLFQHFPSSMEYYNCSLVSGSTWLTRSITSLTFEKLYLLLKHKWSWTGMGLTSSRRRE